MSGTPGPPLRVGLLGAGMVATVDYGFLPHPTGSPIGSP